MSDTTRAALEWIAEYGTREGDLIDGHAEAMRHIARNTLVAAGKKSDTPAAPDADTAYDLGFKGIRMGEHCPGCDPTKRDANGLVCWGCASFEDRAHELPAGQQVEITDAATGERYNVQ